jgi:hypothetical protein
VVEVHKGSGWAPPPPLPPPSLRPSTLSSSPLLLPSRPDPRREGRRPGTDPRGSRSAPLRPLHLAAAPPPRHSKSASCGEAAGGRRRARILRQEQAVGVGAAPRRPAPRRVGISREEWPVALRERGPAASRGGSVRAAPRGGRRVR